MRIPNLECDVKKMIQWDFQSWIKKELIHWLQPLLFLGIIQLHPKTPIPCDCNSDSAILVLIWSFWCSVPQCLSIMFGLHTGWFACDHWGAKLMSSFLISIPLSLFALNWVLFVVCWHFKQVSMTSQLQRD